MSLASIEEKILALAAKLKVGAEVVFAKVHALFDSGVVEAKVLETEVVAEVTKIIDEVEHKTPVVPVEPVAPVAPPVVDPSTPVT